ncbi:hypothetical protein [Burkholderia sp. lig30]|uniref:hypothetical protein n=1 Tax=Burkholderia sp. lig30 TaxID=1192124 RepID=UPI00128EF88C|nr:hypothetical protein [Burkholderia sp. lig30]
MKIDKWVMILGCAVFTIAIPVFVHYRPHRSGDVAAWVQAIGSIGAIFVAIFIAWHQRVEDRRREAVKAMGEVKRKFNGWYAITREAINLLLELPHEESSTIEAAREYFLVRKNRIAREIAFDALNAIHLPEVEPFELRASILELRSATAASLEFFPSGDMTSDMHMRYWLFEQEELERLRDIAEAARSQFDSWSRQLSRSR